MRWRAATVRGAGFAGSEIRIIAYPIAITVPGAADRAAAVGRRTRYRRTKVKRVAHRIPITIRTTGETRNTGIIRTRVVGITNAIAIAVRAAAE